MAHPETAPAKSQRPAVSTPTAWEQVRLAIDREIAAEERELNAKNDRWVAVAEVGLAIRARRKELGLSLREVARRAKISAMFLCDVERGRRMMSDGTCEMILGALQP